jgi:TolB protein
MEPGPAQSDVRLVVPALDPARDRPRRSTVRPLVAILAVAAVVAAACSPANPDQPSASAAQAATSGPASASAAPSAAQPTPNTTSRPAATPAPVVGPLATSGSIVVIRQDGSLGLVDADGGSTLLADTGGAAFGFPTWSPDGSQIAVTRTGTADTSILVFDVEPAPTGQPVVPRVIFQSAVAVPFYLSWTPDGKDVSFLASDPDSLALRIAPADGSAPLDGSGPGAVIRAGNPLYFDWIDSDRLLAHIGAGTTAFLGEIGRDGAAVEPAIKAPGTFRSADVSGDGKFAGFVRAGKSGKDAVVVAARKGSDEQSMPVFGPVALDFSPTDDSLAAVGALQPVDPSLGFPVGPLRLLDARSGKTRTLLDGGVVSFAWSPDGTTIAAIRLTPSPDQGVPTASPSTSPAADGQTTIHMAFVDVASGKVLVESEVRPGPRYVDGVLAYFDQYALSHRLWAPDSASILLPQVDDGGTTHVDVVFRNGDPPVSLDGVIGFWSP